MNNKTRFVVAVLQTAGILVFCTPVYAQTALQAIPKTGINSPYRDTSQTPIRTVSALLADLRSPILLRQMTFADIHWQQVEPQNNQWNFLRPDSTLRNTNGFYPLPTLYGISAGANDTVGLQVPWRACTNPTTCGWNIARDSADAKDYVQTVVRRYKDVTKLWEISNEMEGKMRPPGGVTRDTFALFMQLNYRWIKEIDPEARVLLPGLLGTYGLPLATTTYPWLRDMLQRGVGGSFDIMNYHDYNAWWTLPAHFDSVRAVLKAYNQDSKVVWCSESSVASVQGSDITPTYVSVDEQAADVWRRQSILFAKGADRYLWHGFWSNAAPMGVGTGFAEFGLLDSRGIKKKSFHSYKLFLEKLKDFQSAEFIATGIVKDDNKATDGGNGTWVVRYNLPSGVQRWVAWAHPSGGAYTLATGTANAKRTLTVTDAVPSTITGDGATAQFTQQQVTAGADGAVALTLTRFPKVIEVNAMSSVQTATLPDGASLLISPNPATGQTTAYFTLSRRERVRLVLYDVLGREVALLLDAELEVGEHEWSLVVRHWSLVDGAYFLRLQTPTFSHTKPVQVLR